jgi:hypothetical protein
MLVMAITNVTLIATRSVYFYTPCLVHLAFNAIVPCRIILNLRDTQYADAWDMATIIPLGYTTEPSELDSWDTARTRE